MNRAAAPIAVLRGATGEAIQSVFARFAERWSATIRIAGAIEDAAADELVSIADGSRYRLFQDLGTGAAACGLDSGELGRAGEAVRRDILQRPDLVILSKFGKLEAEERSGLIPAFAAAVEMQVPVLTSVAPRFAGAWSRFADPLSTTLPATSEAVEAWWAQYCPTPQPLQFRIVTQP